MSGLYQAAEIQFWWSSSRSTDALEQLFWFDDSGRPVAAAAITDFGDGTSLVYEDPILAVIVMPDAERDWVDHVVQRALKHAAENGIGNVELEIDRTDDVMRDEFVARGFERRGDGVVECWLDAGNRPEISALHEGYSLSARSGLGERPHHLARPGRLDVEERLNQTSLYNPDLDLVVLDSNDDPAAWGLLWFDTETATGVVEPMRTQDEHQKKGLAVTYSPAASSGWPTWVQLRYQSGTNRRTRLRVISTGASASCLTCRPTCSPGRRAEPPEGANRAVEPAV